MGGLDTVNRIRDSLAAMGHGPWVLAVSGGMDSMVMLDAARATLSRSELVIATFNHGTGDAATVACVLVASTAAAMEIQCVTGAMPPQNGEGTRARTEAHWRHARWQFLARQATLLGARVATGHTRDDQIETVFMRALRGAGPRGLAGLYATSPIARPLIEVSRSDISLYAAARKIPFVTDPSNLDRRHLRNRVRLDLLPAIAARHPNFEGELLEISRRAADWRAQTEAVALTFHMMVDNSGMHSFARAPLRGYSFESLTVLWPALAARAGVVMDWRGTERLAEFTIEGETGQTIQLAGGIGITMSRELINFRSPLSRG